MMQSDAIFDIKRQRIANVSNEWTQIVYIYA